jgi:4'-phosphopantetheinyl transferase
MGLALPLGQFSFLLDQGPDIGVSFAPRLADRPARWRFALLRGSPRHMVAVGVDTDGGPLSLRANHYVPLRGPVPFPDR